MNVDQKALKQRAIVFFARDFLATEFPKVASMMDGLAHVYITANQREANLVLRHDPHGEVFMLDDIERWPQPQPEPDETAFNSDRFLRNYSKSSILNVIRVLQGISQECLEKYRVDIYVDEPVSGYPNLYFNRVFSSAGAKCLHFQTTWVPGYIFFTTDAAQAAPVNIGWHADWTSIVDAHVDNRQKGLAQPAYVIDYGRYRQRIRDAVLTAGKGLYRKMMRRNDFYIDSDASAHWLHVNCLLRSFSAARYSSELVGLSGERYVLFPMHYEPESVLNYFSQFQRQEEIAAQILDTLPINFRLILKEHPSQPGALGLPKWRSLVNSERTIALPGNHDARKLLKLDVVVVSIASTLALESAVAGRPVGVLGQVHFASMPGIKHLDSPKEWLTLLDYQPATLPEIKRWYADFMGRHCFPGSIMRNNTETKAMIDCINLVQERST